MLWLPHNYLENCGGNNLCPNLIYCPEFSDGNDENFDQGSQYESQSLNLEPPDYWHINSNLRFVLFKASVCK